MEPHVTADHVTIPTRALTEIRGYLYQYENLEALPYTFYRDFVQRQLPELSDFSARVRASLEGGDRFLKVGNVPFVNYEERIRGFLILSLTSSIGIPTPTDQVDRKIIWEVGSEKYLPPGHTPTVTEHNLKAELHTDSSFKHEPERYVSFFVVRPASDNGGVTEIVDGRKLLQSLAEDSEGVRCLNLLRSLTYPFRVPTSFTRNRKEDEYEHSLAAIISAGPLIRFRRDTLMAGFKCLPAFATADALWAVNYFFGALKSFKKLTFKLKAGEALLTNNHEILHGRTAFRDRKRLLLRVRMEEDRPASEVSHD